MTPYFGPCRAGLHPEFGWGTPCLSDAAEYVALENPVTGVSVGDEFFPGVSEMRLCTNHADEAEQRAGFYSRRPLTTPVEAS